ncbi:TetR/AcrR family transcriptional regulator [Xanthobacteraceae bacterium A53D]
MSTSPDPRPPAAPAQRKRLQREDRYRQLVEVALRIVREEGTEALTLGSLAVAAGVTKPVTYSHFTTRHGLLAALYQAFEARQTAVIEAAIENSPADLEARATVIADAYVDCVLTEGREMPGVAAALAGAPELEQIRRESEAVFLEKCRAALAVFTGGQLRQSGLRAMLGAADALSLAALSGELPAADARRELAAVICDMVAREAA